MVDNTIKIIFKSDYYAYVQFTHPTGQLAKKFVYANKKDLEYGDKAEILGAVMGKDFLPFINSVLTQKHFTREHYGYTLGFQPADFDNQEIKEDEARVYYADAENTISKRELFELAILLCEAKLNGWDLQEDNEVSRKDLLSIKSQLEEKIKAV
ncbi:hypothetical protein BWK63_13785 [Flavobacterium covae]|uniref:Uncharacterized protein n=1 Tax=Flavobacterium covae TaxID=2906076 RepID=A0ABW8PJR8_9FLAO|nr:MULTISPECIES: hypothetical protein [Flavobacterium]OWP79919.1 hypothetical protein BWK63_13785 [Flavobacterium covae]POR20063.1 hypothetical protein BWK57_13370 [Flavobacterium columnare]